MPCRSQRQQATGFIDLSEPQPDQARAGATIMGTAVASASGPAAMAAEVRLSNTCSEMECSEVCLWELPVRVDYGHPERNIPR